MAGVSFRHWGSFKNVDKFLKKAWKKDYWDRLAVFGERGVEALKRATPKDSGLTAASWRYEIRTSDEDCAIYWLNDNVVDDWFVVAVGLQYGHTTGTGGWVEGIDYINPAIQPIFQEIAEDVWAEIGRW